jgi:hypothetical protein
MVLRRRTWRAVNAIELSNTRPQVAAMNQIRDALHAFDFLQPRPQVAATNQTQGALPHWERYCCKSAISSEDKSYRRLFNLCTKSKMSNLQFFRRLPLADPDTASAGPWLWVCCSPELQDRGDDDGVDTFVDTTSPLLEGLFKHSNSESSSSSRTPASHHRRLTPCSCGSIALLSCKTGETTTMSTHSLILHPRYSRVYSNSEPSSSSRILANPSVPSPANHSSPYGCESTALLSCKAAETMTMSTHSLTLHLHYSRAYSNSESSSSSRNLAGPSIPSLAN